jgi:hypothetical protein
MKEFEKLIMALYKNNYNCNCCAAPQQQDQRENTPAYCRFQATDPEQTPKKMLDFI